MQLFQFPQTRGTLSEYDLTKLSNDKLPYNDVFFKNCK